MRAVAYGLYQGRMREAIHALKYDRLAPGGAGPGPHARRGHRATRRRSARPRCWWFPCRCTASKHAQRGFNQARSLAAEALGFLRKSHPEWRLTLAPSTLMRLRATESQAGLTPRQRRLNVRGAFHGLRCVQR